MSVDGTSHCKNSKVIMVLIPAFFMPMILTYLIRLSFRRSPLWNTLKDEVRRAGALTKFKKLIAKWDDKACHCLVCK